MNENEQEPGHDAEAAASATDPDGEETDAERTDADEPAADVGVEVEEIEVDDELVERVAEADPESVAHELATLRERVDQLAALVEAEREEAEALDERLTRKQAEFQNFKKRMERRVEEEEARATEALVSRIVEVRDNLARGLDQEGDIREGVESTLRQFDDVLDAEGVTRVDPAPGEAVDPTVHEVLTQIPSDQPEGTVAEVHRPGYELGGKVVQTAQVLVSDGSAATE